MRALWRGLVIFLILLAANIIVMISLRQEVSGATWLTYNSDLYGTWDIYRQIGNDLERLTDFPTDELTPFWSVDGEAIYYISFRDAKSIILRLDLADRTEVPITETLEVNASFASFARDGQWILMTGLADNHSYDIFRISMDGLEITSLIGTEANETAASLSPDGRSIVYYALLDSSNRLGLFHYSLVDKTTQQFVLDDLMFVDPYPASWSPDGVWITFGAIHDGNNHVYRMRVANGDLQQLTTSPKAAVSPAWSPDGRWIAYVSFEDGATNIYRMRPDGSDKQQMTDDGGYELYPTWSPLIDTRWKPNILLGVAYSLAAIIVVLSVVIQRRSGRGV
jgi:Tol biopolymer transport system component